MKLKAVSGIMLILLVASVLALAFDIQPVQASGTIYIDSDYTFTSNIYEPIVVTADNITIDGNGYTLQGNGSGTGITLSGRSNITIKNTEIKAFDYGIFLYSSSNNTISGNNITNNSWDGISLSSSSGNTISGNNLTNNHYGILFDSSSGNIISGNAVANNSYGIFLYSSSSNTLRNNDASNNTRNFGVYGSVLSYYLQDIDDSNTVNGKPIYYWVDRRNAAVPLDAGYVALINCTFTTVQNLNLTNNGQGVLLAFTTNSTISGNAITNNGGAISLYYALNNTISENDLTKNGDYGILLHYASNNVVSGNNITANEADGIYFYYSSDNIVLGNYISNNRHGIRLYSSSNNTISGNNIANNNYDGIYLYYASGNTISGNNITANNWNGIELYMSSNNSISGNNIRDNGAGVRLMRARDNIIHHNDLVDNTQQVLIEASGYANVWDDGYPSGGNYWSDHNPPDIYSGPYQNETGSDGIGDIPYVIDGNNTDGYPLIYPYGYVPGPDVNGDRIVNIQDILIAAIAFGSYPGHPKWNAIADLNQDGIINILDLVIIAVNFGKTY